MPPAAIPSSVFTAGSISSRRRSSSSAELGGNFGARPKPPQAGSNSSPSPRPARWRSDGVHVDRVHVRALLAVDFDVDEALVHESSRLVVLEGLVCHHVAPVTGGVADREQDRLVLLPRTRERFL